MDVNNQMNNMMGMMGNNMGMGMADMMNPMMNFMNMQQQQVQFLDPLKKKFNLTFCVRKYPQENNFMALQWEIQGSTPLVRSLKS